jgi:glycosyltransferase involved in cell wall biosynthesis
MNEPKEKPKKLATMDGEPLVSVIIPAYNVAPFVEDTLSSVFAQTFDNYEVIVINDGSPDSDELERILMRYLDRINYIKQTNQGAGAARNAGLRAARGRFVAFLDGDDMWLPMFLEEQLTLIDSHGGYDLVYADAVNFGDSLLAGRPVMETYSSEGEANFESLLAGRCGVITSAVVARREPIIELGMFDESIRNSQDFDLWLRLSKREGARFTYQRKILVRRRIYEGSLSADSIKGLEGELRVLEKTAQRKDLTFTERETLERTRALRRAAAERIRGKRQLMEGDFHLATRSFQIANENCPGWKTRTILVWLRLAPRLLRYIYKASGKTPDQ